MRTMKKVFFAAAFAAVLSACCSAPGVELTVSNPLAADRNAEVVEVAWADVAAGLAGLTPENVVVLDAQGAQVPSQAVFYGDTVPRTLIFEATVPASGQSTYKVVEGVREEYPVKAYGRYVPERADDYAWENNMVAYRLYGPALETTPKEMLVTPGIDVWVKSTEKMVIDERYKRGHYHTNYGDGMDCYKVGRTLGAGACAPFVDGKLWMSRNYATQQNLDNGPLRTTVKLTYAPFAAGEDSVSLVKYISLDANTPFTKMTNIYSGDFETMPVAAGVVMHDVKGKFTSDTYAGITEAASDSKQPEEDGDISLAVIMPAADSSLEAEGHMLTVGQARNGQPLVYYIGSGWSGASVPDVTVWEGVVKDAAQKIANPMTVTVKAGK